MKTVLLLIHDDDGQEARLQAALDATRALEGHLTCLHVTEYRPIVGDAYGMSGSVMLLEVTKEMEAENRAKIEKRLATEDVPFDWIEMTSALAPAIEEAADLADLIVVNAELANYVQPDVRRLVDRLVTKTRTPLLAVRDAEGFRPADPVLVAWNGSDPASAALRSAIPLLRMSDSVTLFEVDDGHGSTSSEDAAEYLSRHGIKSQIVREKATSDDSVPSLILSELESGRFGWAVMGAFSTSRFRQALFGGTTRQMLREAPVPLLVAH
jgi:nucleotide-binding universal stress UspA family protein